MLRYNNKLDNYEAAHAQHTLICNNEVICVCFCALYCCKLRIIGYIFPGGLSNMNFVVTYNIQSSCASCAFGHARRKTRIYFPRELVYFQYTLFNFFSTVFFYSVTYSTTLMCTQFDYYLFLQQSFAINHRDYLLQQKTCQEYEGALGTYTCIAGVNIVFPPSIRQYNLLTTMKSS